ncbi:MAG: MlaD family protein [Geminicoccaceae bacterium]
MEVRASYLLVGSIVLALVVGLAAFSVWLVRADVDRDMARYEIAFEGSVSGLQEGSQVYYRGVPVGRVADIRIDPQNVEQVLVTVDIERAAPIKQDTVATLEMQGVTGLAYVQLRGGTQASAALEPGEGGEPPRIPARRSALERVFESTPDLLAQALTVADRLSVLLNDGNLEAAGAILANLRTFSGALAGHADEVGAALDGTATAADQVAAAASDLRQLSGDLRRLVAKLDHQVDGTGGQLVQTLTELRGAATALGGAAGQLDGMVGDLRQPLDDFAGSGLYDFTQLIGETRMLIAALTRISKEFERDPASFLLGSSQKGFQPK